MASTRHHPRWSPHCTPHHGRRRHLEHERRSAHPCQRMQSCWGQEEELLPQTPQRVPQPTTSSRCGIGSLESHTDADGCSVSHPKILNFEM
jgi:hypothetical protein